MLPAAHMRVLPSVYCKPVRHTLKLAPLISRARQRPIASTGRQGNCCSACRASTECDAAQLRNAVCQPDTHSEAAGASRASDGLRCAAPRVLRRQASKYHSEAADASQASDRAEMCGPACPATPSQQIPQRSRGREPGERPGGGVRTRVPACCRNKKRGRFRPPALFDI